MATSSNIPAASKAVATQTTCETKTFSVTLPAGLAAKLEALAEREGSDLNEIFVQALQDYYRGVIGGWLSEIQEYAETRNPHGYTEDDIPRLIKEVRTEMATEEAVRQTAKAS